jgi:hypothetical protein
MDVPLGAQRPQSAAYAAPAASDHGLGEDKGIATGSKSSLAHKNRTGNRRKKALTRSVLQKNIHFSAACEAMPQGLESEAPFKG